RRARQSDRALCLVEVAESDDARIGLADATLSEQRRLAAVAGAGGDARRAGRSPRRRAFAGWHAREHTSDKRYARLCSECFHPDGRDENADWSRRGQRQEREEEIQRAARKRAEEEDRRRAGPADDDRARAAQAQGEGLVAIPAGIPDGAGVQQAGAVFRFGS